MTRAHEEGEENHLSYPVLSEISWARAASTDTEKLRMDIG